VQEVLARRLGRLSDPCRAVLVAAAVLGRAWPFELLEAMVGADEDELIARLEEARDAQLIVERDGGFAFTHALVRETLYAGTSGPRRRRLHAQAAAALERAGTRPPVAALALHHRLAGTAGDAEKAIRYSLEAGAQAAERFGWEEAAEQWDGAVAVMAREGGRERDQARLLVAIADLMVMLGDLDRQIARLERARELYEGLGDGERLAQVHSRLGMAHSLMDTIYAEHLDIGAAFAHFEAARPVLAQGPPRRARGHLEVGIATALTYNLQIEPGLAAAREAMEIADAVGDAVLWAGAAEAFAWHALVAGRLSEAFALLDRAFAAADAHRRPFLAFMAANIRGQFTWGVIAPDDAQAHFERPLRLPYVGTAAYRRQIADGIGRCHATRGEFDAARRQLPEASPTWITHSLKPVLDLWDGDLAAVEALAADTLATSRRTANRWDEWASHHLAARVLALRGEHAGAAERLGAALAILVDGGAPYFELWVRPDLARMLAALGRRDEARTEVERCREIEAAGEDWRGRAGLVHLADAVVLAAEGRADEADERFVAARDVLRRHAAFAEETEVLYEWGRLLGLGERLDEAAERYRDRGAGRLWLERDTNV
jgi:tetratricopeptide (TPR) repeat protein